jgi:ElaB/YqjD/DUF883 family membrane-anchored ribosome-binding protein
MGRGRERSTLSAMPAAPIEREPMMTAAVFASTIRGEGIFTMVANLWRHHSDVGDDLEAQIARLSREVASLKRTLSKRGAAAYEDTSERTADLYEDVLSRISDAMPDIKRQSRAVQKAAHDNPVVTAVVGVAVIGLLLGLLARR